MNLRPALAAFALALLLTGCGDDPSGSSDATDRSGTSTDASAGTSSDTSADPSADRDDDGGDADPAPVDDSPEGVYASFREALVDGDVDVLRRLVREDYWSDIDAEGDTLEERLAGTSALVAEGTLVLPETPTKVVVGADEIGVPDDYLEQAKAEDVALITLADADTGSDEPRDVDLILLEVGGAWVVFGMEPS